jgi:CBS domain-containing protein
MPVKKTPKPGDRKIRDVMTHNVECIEPMASARDAAAKMKTTDIGAFPVCEGDRVLGMITDRDLAIRILAEGKDPVQTKVRDVMSQPAVTCSPDDDLEKAEAIMEEKQLRRIPVVEDGKLVGLFSVGRVAKVEDEHKAGRVMKSVTQRRKVRAAS